MDAEKQEIRLEFRQAEVAEVVPLIEKAAPFHCNGWPFDANEVAKAGPRYVCEQDGVPVFGFVLEIQGKEVFVMAAGSVGKLDFTKIGLSAIEALAANYDSVSFTTKRPGLVKKAQKLGYEIDGYFLRKKIKK